MQHSIKLFSAHSIVKSFENHRNVVFHWFKCGTKFDGVDYKNLVDGFWQLDNRERYLCILHVNEYFTESECTLLQKYLKLEYDTELFIDEQVLPMKLLEEGNGDVFSYSAISCSNRTYNLTRDEPCDLPFEVRGYYDLEQCLPSQDLPDRMKHSGLEFLWRALDMLYPPGTRLDFAKLKFIVDEIYQGHNLYVDFNPYKDEIIPTSKLEKGGSSYIPTFH
jgi:hypothetical protein